MIGWQALQRIKPGLNVFFDRESVSPGESWLMRIASSLDAARRVVALYTPSFWVSKYCKDEHTAAYVRQTDTGEKILFPILFRDTPVPYR